MSKLWFGSSMRPYPGDEPRFFEPNEFTWTGKLEENWPVIKEELHKLIAEQDKKFQSSTLLYEKLAPTGKWSNLQFLYWGMKFSNGLKKCPTLNSLLKQIPGIVSIGLSKLDPHSVIPEHSGDSNASYRGQFGIEIPGPLPLCGLSVGGESRGWEEGKWLIFNDAHKHSAWNNSDKRRIILLIDVIRPEFMHKKNIACAFVLTRYVSFFYNRYKLIAKLPSPIKSVLFGISLIIIYLFKPVYNLFKA